MSSLDGASLDSAPRRQEIMGGLAKGLAIVELFDGTRAQLTLAEAAKETGVTRAAARRCLLTLKELGYVSYDGKYFAPRPRMLRLGRGYMQPGSFLRSAQEILAEVRDELDEPISLAILDGDETVFVARSEASRAVSTGVRLRGRLPVYCSATGRILLSDRPRDEIVRMLERSDRPELTPHTLTAVPEIADAIETAGRNGVCYVDQEFEVGMRSMAVPIGPATRIAAALSLSTLAARIDLKHMQQVYFPVLRRYAEILSQLTDIYPEYFREMRGL